ncbi:MAG: hypothetical protein NC131_10200 [Roseburia sp.]|nr:hypothetical protein [Roseburia sp.]
MKEKIEIYLKRIDLKPELELVCDVFKFIEQCDARRINDLEERMAALFCRSVACLPQDDITKDVKELLLNAFENIRTMANEVNGTSELRTIFLLNQVYQSNAKTEYDEIIGEDFVLLLDNLEKIRILFRIVDEDANEYFPISSLLFNLINSDNLLRDISKVKTIQALMLALQIFDKNKYPKQFEDIENIVQEKKLKFVDYLLKGACRLGGDDWKSNYEKNGTLILYNNDRENGSILIRNMDRQYFDIDRSIQEIYNFSEIYEEKNEENIGVAYYVEYSLKDFDTVDLKKEFSIPNNRKSILQILKIIYEDKCYNILFENALFRDFASIRIINPFSKNDTYTIVNGNSVTDGFIGVTEWLKKYGLVTLAGKGIEIVNLGTLISLEKICNVNFDLIGITDENITFAKLLTNWIRNCGDKRDSFNIFLKEYTEKLKYIYDIEDLFGKEFKNDYFMPYSIEEELLKELDFDEVINTLPIDTFNIKRDFLNENRIISRIEDDKDFSDYEIKDIMGDTTNGLSGDVVACIDKKNHILYTGMEVKYYILLKEKITQLNNKVLCKDVIDKIDEFSISQFEKMMLCFRAAYNKVHPEILMNDIVRYRLAHHLLLLQLNQDKVKPWIDLLNRHEIVEYSFVNRLPHSGELGVLYIPKDRSRSQSTFKYIYEEYIANPLERDIVDIYDQKITLEKDGYYVGHQKITKVVFLFDLIQNGRATIDTLEYYLNKDSVEDNIHMVFYCNDIKVSVAEILRENSACEVEIYTIYSGKGGRKKVQDYIDKKLSNKKPKVLKPLKELTCVLSKEDNELCESIYQGRLKGQIYPGDYMVIREYNQPKHNIMSDEIMRLEKIVALFCKRAENY